MPINSDVVSNLRAEPVIRAVFSAAAAAGIRAYLVGGLLRNIAMSCPFGIDYDVALEGDVRQAAERIAVLTHGSPFLLDKESQSYRVCIKQDSKVVNIDLSPLKGRDIYEDLMNRDFTINALAVDINLLFDKGCAPVIDVCGGACDAENRVIRMVCPEIFDRDPLRLLRAVRLSAQYNLSIEEKTEACVKEKAGLIIQSSRERIRDEFFNILAGDNAAAHIKNLNDSGLLEGIMPEIRQWREMNGYDLFNHAVKTVSEGEGILYDVKSLAPEFSGKIENYLQKPFGSVPVRRLLKFAMFAHDAGKPATMSREEGRIRFLGHEPEGERICRHAAKRLKLSRAAAAYVARLAGNHHRFFNLAMTAGLSFRSKAHFFRALGGEDGISLLILSIADARATRNSEDSGLESLAKDMIDYYYRVYAVKRPKPLLNGNEVMKICGIPEGIMVGRILRQLSDAEAAGLVKTKKEAISYLLRN